MSYNNVYCFMLGVVFFKKIKKKCLKKCVGFETARVLKLLEPPQLILPLSVPWWCTPDQCTSDGFGLNLSTSFVHVCFSRISAFLLVIATNLVMPRRKSSYPNIQGVPLETNCAAGNKDNAAAAADLFEYTRYL